MKRCKTCGETKPLDEFRNNRHHRDGKHSECKVCHSDRERRRRQRVSSAYGPLYYKHKALKDKYKLTPEQVDELLDDQDGRCAVCEEDLSDGFRVDHDHSCCPGQYTCGKCLRGLVCHRCNVLIGFLEVNEDLIEKAKAYVLRGCPAGPMKMGAK